MLVVFQPHLFSRTRDFADWFCGNSGQSRRSDLIAGLSGQGNTHQGISSATILNKMEKVQAKILDKPEVLARAQSVQPGEKMVLITAGAGDIDDLVKPLTEILKAK